MQTETTSAHPRGLNPDAPPAAAMRKIGAAVELARSQANRLDESKALTSMGLIAMDQRCANKGSEALPWLMKAATFRAETPWEKGRGASIAGESGYFNTRASSTQAALALGNLFAASGFPAMKWYWVQRAASQFAEDEREGDELRNAARELGKAIPVEDQQRISAHWDAKQPWHKQIAAPQTTQGDKP